MMRVVHQRPMLANVQKRKVWLAINAFSKSKSGAAEGAANNAIAINQPLCSSMNKG